MIFDTDVLIWVQRGNRKAGRLIEGSEERYLSVCSYMELLQAAKNSQQLLYIKDFLSSFGFVVLPLSESIGHRAFIYLEEYALSQGLRAGDAIIAATAAENNMELLSSNAKHFRPIKDLRLRVFRP